MWQFESGLGLDLIKGDPGMDTLNDESTVIGTPFEDPEVRDYDGRPSDRKSEPLPLRSVPEAADEVDLLDQGAWRVLAYVVEELIDPPEVVGYPTRAHKLNLGANPVADH
jgi:hypothetical protein